MGIGALLLVQVTDDTRGAVDAVEARGVIGRRLR
jgi:hypothetical protein